MLPAIPPTSQAPDWLERERSRLQDYQEAREFTDGLQWIGRKRRGETRITLNYARALIRKVASYTLPEPVMFSVTGPDATANAAEKLLAEQLAALSAHELDLQLCIEASALGDAAIKVTWDPRERSCVLGQVDPATLSAEWDPSRPDRASAMEQRYQLPGAAIAATMPITALDSTKLYPVLERWTETIWHFEITGLWEIDQPNPYGWIPYVVLANERPPRSFWGQSDLADLYEVARELNQRVSTLSKILELSGAPIAVLENVDGSEGITVGPGAKWELPEGSKAYLLDLLEHGGVGLHIEYVNALYRALHDLSETPRTAFGDTGKTLSGAALEVEIQPLVQRVRRKRTALGRFYAARNRRMLDLMERFGAAPISGLRVTSPTWPSVLPSDEDALVRNEVQLVSAEIHSKRTAMVKLGNEDPDGEIKQIETEKAASQPQATPGTTPAGKP